MDNLQSLFRTNTRENKKEWRVFGMEPRTFVNSTENPQKQEQLDSCQFEGENENHSEVSCHTISEYVIISKDNKIYVFFNICICILCLVSTYYYGLLAVGRYHFIGGLDLHEFWVVVTIESIFLLHLIV